ncbi:MAG: bifunctional adenosylcobinamide kinase/adenosylcobinamide-phosphate guanylyltransferase [Acidimicrobiales bacterium mtb01]|nr:bifunctional adenosylcobinamide kinase/adenosylcobinamide-phosphate guanylyltransferase [Actinomycetota bacterium]TEX47858.1 MAG: bifunctional adenosylcobinamide kinase/adenosylcobinamide-phosphate guanylyltransferase [Acidimicrobiales bacterium mtb01]
MLVVVTGGARSGKSTFAVDYGVRHPGPVVFVATAPSVDDDMRVRIDRHRAERPDWPTVEEPCDIAPVVSSATAGSLVIIDCLTLWVSNLMWRGDSDAEIERAAELLAASVPPGVTVLAVTNEVGLGVHPETDLGRRYRDVLGRVNQRVVIASDRALFMVAGRAIGLSDPWDLVS